MGTIAKWLGGNAGGIVNAGVNLYSAIQNNKNIDKQLAAQSAENEKNRKYNLQLAQLQNSWNIAMQDRENAYNTPSAQKARLEAAGLNPDMMYGGVVSNTSAPSPAMTSGAPSNPMDWSSLANKKTVGQITAETLNNEMTRAQIDKVKAETDKTQTETGILTSDLSFRDAWNAGLLELQNMDILGKFSEIQLNDQQVKESQSRVRNLDADTAKVIQTYDLIKAQISNYEADTAYKILKGVLESKEVDALVKKLHAETILTRAECRSIVSRLPYELLGLKADAEYTSTQSEFISLQNDVLSFQFGQDKSYDDWKRSTMIAGSVVNCLEGLASIIGTAFGGGKPTRVRGFR